MIRDLLALLRLPPQFDDCSFPWRFSVGLASLKERPEASQYVVAHIDDTEDEEKKHEEPEGGWSQRLRSDTHTHTQVEAKTGCVLKFHDPGKSTTGWRGSYFLVSEEKATCQLSDGS